MIVISHGLNLGIKEGYMKNLFIERTEETPRVCLNFDEEYGEFRGESWPVDSMSFYTPIFTWIDDYFKLKKNFTMCIDVGFFASSSLKSILDLCMKLDQYHEQNCNVKLIWKHDRDDDYKEMGKDLRDQTSMDIEIIKV
jgi:hypothetical protein